MVKITLFLCAIIGFQACNSINTFRLCPLNEIYSFNSDNPQITCSNYGSNYIVELPSDGNDDGLTVNRNCYCRTGYARKFEGGPCVRLTDPECLAQLPATTENCILKGEVFRTFSNGCYFEPTCEVPIEPAYDPLRMCTMAIVEICLCRNGMVRNNQGKCVLLKDC
ncbi:hypothetical protein HA402_002312 [Bradysia odoriphaga]|nr:hypothetical protein HA402_002312 [Bradysia odoriphaga]